MPLYTPYYSLAAFLQGDVYSSFLDYKRFTTIDANIALLAQVVGDGRISGWALSDATVGGNIAVDLSSGWGIINKNIIKTYGTLNVSLEDNATNYIYLQYKPFLSGLVGPFSEPSSVTFSDAVAPAAPVGLSISDVTSSSLSLSWTANSEADLSYYILQQSQDAVVYTTVVETSNTEYPQVGLTENTTYYYRLYAVDASGNTSVSSAVVSTTTLKDFSSPQTPANFLCFSGDGQISCIWLESVSSYTDHYVLTTQKVDFNYTPIGAITSDIISYGTDNYIIYDLDNDQPYEISLYAVSQNGVYSNSNTVIATPKVNSGPAEASNLSISFSSDPNNPLSVSLLVNWDDGYDPYKSLAEYYRITVIENSTTTYDHIDVYNHSSGFLINSLKLNGMIFPIMPQTNYIVKIQGIDSDGDINAGSVVGIFTGLVVPPSAPSNFNAYLTNSDLFFSWVSSTSSFSHNEIKILARNRVNNATSTLISSTNVGKSSTYIVPISSLIPNYEYTLYAKAVNESSQESDESSISITIEPLDYSNLAGATSSYPDKPPPVTKLYSFGGNGNVLLIWSPTGANNISYYKIWRTEYKIKGAYETSDYTLVETLPSEVTSYIDYGLVNNTRYVYFITTVDAFGNESLNPIDGYYYHVSTNTLPTEDKSKLSSVSNVVATQVGFDVSVSWDALSENFDCYEIFYSPLNKYSWEKVGAVNKGTTTFTHSNALVNGSGEYYYAVRASRNEGRLISSFSEVAPVNSILVAKVTTMGGAISSIEDLTRDIYKLEDFITEKITPVLSTHTHKLTLSADKRIDLSTNAIVTEWATFDRKTFQTNGVLAVVVLNSDNTVTIIEATSYIIRMDGNIINIPFAIDPISGIISFDSVLASDNISVELVGLSETTGVLDENSIGTVDASQLSWGQLYKEQLPQIPHSGRKMEELTPLQFPMISSDQYLFKIYQNINSDVYESLGSARTFYDIVEASDGMLISSTSNGVMSSSDGGETWIEIFVPYAPIHRIKYLPILQKYLGLSNGKIYISDDGKGWAITNGTEDASIARDVAENGNKIFASTDNGVYVLDLDGQGEFLRWQALTFYSGETSDTYALWYDIGGARMVVSSEIGLFETYNDGITWSYTDEFEEMIPVHDFAVNGNYVFALTDYGVYRKNFIYDSYFMNVMSFDASMARNLNIFNNRIWISTDNGVFVSGETELINYDFNISSQNDVYLINFSKKTTIANLLKSIGGKIYIGTDKHLFAGSSLNDIEQLYKQSSYTEPTFYVNNTERKIGVFYSSANDVVYFDSRINDDYTVSVANQYSYFISPNGEWVSKNFDTNVNIYSSAGLLSTLVNGSTPLTVLQSVTFDTFTENNSNSSIANYYVNLYVTELDRFSSIVGGASSLETGETEQDIVSNLISLYHKVYSQYFGNNIYGSLKTINSNSYLVVGNLMYLASLSSVMLKGSNIIENIPSFEFTSLLTPTMVGDASSGIFSFGSTTFSKYNLPLIDVENSNISNAGSNTHKEIDDALSEYDSGLPYSLSEVANANMLKMGIFLRRELGASESDLEYQSKYILPCDLNWYDSLNSTVDYSQIVECGSLGVDVNYPVAVLHVLERRKVLAAYASGIVEIDVKGLDMRKVELDSKRSENVRDLFKYDDIIYALTDYHIYKSSDYGISWGLESTNGMSGRFYRISATNNNLVCSTNNGIYCKNIDTETWTLATEAVLGATQLISHNGVFALYNNSIFYSVNGMEWVERDSFGDILVNEIVFFKELALLPTNSGLRHDSGTVYGPEIGTTIIYLENTLADSSALKVNSVAVNSDENAFMAGSSDGKFYLWELDNQTITSGTDSTLDTIHKIIYVDGDYWMFGGDKLRVSGYPFAVKVSTGSPM